MIYYKFKYLNRDRFVAPIEIDFFSKDIPFKLNRDYGRNEIDYCDDFQFEFLKKVLGNHYEHFVSNFHSFEILDMLVKEI